MNENEMSLLQSLQPLSTQVRDTNRRTASERLQELEKRILKLTEDNSRLEKGIMELQTDVATLNAERACVSNRLAMAEEYAATLENNLVEVLVRRSQLEKLIEKRAEENSRLEKICNEACESRDALRRRISYLRNEASLETDIDSFPNRCDDSLRDSDADDETDKENTF